ncbi:2-oxoglutarate and iron-dependent oxygenase domain-containing protein [Mesorhizobium sp.]|uniref:2-oxoglutarate and iron-dependent oxygenase domain-containing protein n=1 Tax=Mesorhizobium sp. TaxID=1871066 RepID=UPI00338EC07D
MVDIAPLLDGSNKQAVAKQIRWALSNTGFMYVKNHGIPQGVRRFSVQCEPPVF